MEIKYPNSPLSVEAPGASRLGDGAPRAGDRAPDVPLRKPDGSRARLFDAFREPCHVMLLFEGESAPRDLLDAAASAAARRTGVIAVRRIARAPAGDPASATALYDPDGAAHKRYGAAHGAIYLVRPDGYIAFRGALSDAAALEADLERRFTVGV